MTKTSPFASEPRKVEMSQLSQFISQGRMPTLPGPSKSEGGEDFASKNFS